ncbi:MAG: cell division protein FtsZ [Bacteroidales bacterium]|jgi:cell division protein FtsZ|nr:cell division protein FtsZ [Bacteroidales bacterium]
MNELNAIVEEDIVKIAWAETQTSIIKVIGVGGGGGNAVSYMYQQGIHNVNFIICNTDAQALDKSPIPTKIRLGNGRTEGLGAGGKPEVGRDAAMESEGEIREMLNTGTRMVFVTAGMGGGTGTGAAPVIARIAKEMGILTVAIVTIPFRFEGAVRHKQAVDGINELEGHVDSLLVIDNEKIREIFGDLKASQAFSKADDVLTTAAKGIAELITRPGIINVDFADVRSIMTNGGITVMGSAKASGENRARQSVEAALTSPLLNSSDITGAGRILLNISSGTDEYEITMDEISEITDFVTNTARNANLIWGTATDEHLGDAISVTIVATYFMQVHTISPPLTDKVELEPNRNNPATSTQQTLPNTGGVTRGNFVVRERTPERPAVQTEISWGYPAQQVETEEKPYIAPLLTDEHVDLEILETVPAYKRRQMNIAQLPAETEQTVSKYTLSTDPQTNQPRIRESNAYLNDRVD